MPYKPKEHVDPEDYVPKGDWSKYRRQICEKLDPLFPGLLDELETENDPSLDTAT